MEILLYILIGYLAIGAVLGLFTYGMSGTFGNETGWNRVWIGLKTMFLWFPVIAYIKIFRS